MFIETINKNLRILAQEVFTEDSTLEILEEELFLEELLASPRFYGSDHDED